MKKLLVFVTILVIMISNTFGFSLMNSMAGVHRGTPKINYYTSIEVKPGDSLWSISSQYAADTDLSTREYVKLVKKMNGITSDEIHAGSYLTVMYQVEE